MRLGFRAALSGDTASRNGIDDLVKAVNGVDHYRARSVAKNFERRFTAEVMTANYERIYYELVAVRLNGVNAEGGVAEGKMRACATTRY
jgi:hypothetical protein